MRGNKSDSNIILFFVLLVPLVLTFLSCETQIRYHLAPGEVVKAEKTIPMAVQIMTFTDARNRIEREKTARREAGFNDLNDYTYDWHFRGNEAEAITKMIVDHLQYAGVFTRIWRAPGRAESLSDKDWNSLRQKRVDAVMTGEVLNFYAYYDENPLRKNAYGLGVLLTYYAVTWGLRREEIERSVLTGDFNFQTYDLLAIAPAYFLGTLLDSLHKRKMEFRTKLRTRLIDTRARAVIWEDTFELSGRTTRNKKGVFEDKFKLALDSLRETNNRMVESLTRLKQQDRP